MGLMLGKVESDTMIIHDSFALPVEGTEIRVNASMQGMILFHDLRVFIFSTASESKN